MKLSAPLPPCELARGGVLRTSSTIAWRWSLCCSQSPILNTYAMPLHPELLHVGIELGPLRSSVLQTQSDFASLLLCLPHSMLLSLSLHLSLTLSPSFYRSRSFK